MSVRDTKNMIFDNDKVTALVIKYNSNGRSVEVLGDIFAESNALLSVIATKYCSGDNDLKDDLMQEARVRLFKALPDWNPYHSSGSESEPKKASKIFSYVSAVARNTMVDVVRKFKPEVDIDDVPALTLENDDNESDYVTVLVDGLKDWFADRFPTEVRRHLATEVLENILIDLMNLDVGKRKAIDNLVVDYEFEREAAKYLYEAVVVTLRRNSESYGVHPRKAPERSLHPEFKDMVGDEAYQDTSTAFSGLSLRFPKGKS